MKKLALRLLLVFLLASFALFAVGCKPKDGTSESVSESTSQSVSESTGSSESTSEKESESEVKTDVIVGAGENGEVNLGGVLDVFAPVLDNDYITVKFTLDASATVNQLKNESKTEATAYVRQTLNGYDVVAMFTQADTALSVYVYYVDGLAVYGITEYKEEGSEIVWYKSEIGSFNSLISQLNAMIASDEQAVESYKELMKAVEKLEVLLSEGDLVNKNLSPSFDLSQILNGILNFVVANKDVDVYSFLLANVWGVDVSNPEEVTAFENWFIEWCNTNPTVSALIKDVVDGINQSLIEEARAQAEANGVAFDESTVFQINLEQLLGLLQEQIGMSTAQIIDLVKTYVPELEDYLTAPEEGETLYGYLDVRMQMITVDDIAKAITGDQDATLLTALWGLKQEFAGVTVGSVVNGMLNELLGATTDGEDNRGEVVQPKDYLAMVEELKLSLQAYVVGVTFKTDAYGRPTELGQSSRVQISYVNPETGLSTDIITSESEEILKVTFSYAEPLMVKFEIPQDVLDKAIESGEQA